jgi:hypothetical protein
MADNGRLNKVIDLLEHGQAVFSCGTIPNGNFDEIAALGQSDYDLIILETEHVGFDFPTLGARGRAEAGRGPVTAHMDHVEDLT